jgi:hypothetical protein
VKIKCKKDDFTRLCLIGKPSRNDSDSNSDISDDLSFEILFSKVDEFENVLCNQDKLFCKVFCENKKLNLKLENSFTENCNMIMVNYADLWIVQTQVAHQLKCAKLELKELKARSLLLVACTSCPMLKSDLEACSIEIKELKHKIDHSSCYHVFSPPCEICISLRGKLFNATKDNIELK